LKSGSLSLLESSEPVQACNGIALSLPKYRDTTNVEPEMYDYTSNNWSHWNSNEKLKEKFGSYTRKTFDRFSTIDSYTWNIIHNTESTAV